MRFPATPFDTDRAIRLPGRVKEGLKEGLKGQPLKREKCRDAKVSFQGLTLCCPPALSILYKPEFYGSRT
jgi:hypothetical protein